MKKILAIILAIAMATMVFACTPAADDPAPTPPPAPPPANGDGVEGGVITVWCWDPAFNLFAMEEAAKIYRADNPGFEINIVEMPWDDIQTALITASTTGVFDTLPDILLMQDMAFQKNVMLFPELFADLTGSGIDFGQFAAGKVGFSTVGDRNFGVPFDNGATVTALRTDLLEQAGFTIADFTDVTWAQFIERGQAVLAATGMPLVSTIAGGGDYTMFMLQSAGSSMFNPDHTPNIAGNATLYETIEVYRELVRTGVLLEVSNWDEYIASFVSGDVVGTISGCWILGSVQLTEGTEGNWAVTNIPRLEVAGGTNYSNWGGSSWAVTSVSANTDLAVDFLANTFAGSVEFYEIILPASGAIGTWAPAAASTVYSEPHPFFGGQAVFADIVRFGGNIPTITTGVFFYEARDAVQHAVVNILGGADVTAELQAAQSTVEFQIS